MILLCYLQNICTYFSSFTGHQDDIFKGISNWHVERSKFGEKNYKYRGKKKKLQTKLYSVEFLEFVFSKSVLGMFMSFELACSRDGQTIQVIPGISGAYLGNTLSTAVSAAR